MANMTKGEEDSGEEASHRFVALIPARGGSRRLPGKNLVPVCGRPLLDWTLLAARTSGVFDKIILTSDADDILARAHLSGIENITPLPRPAALASDQASSLDVIFHALAWLEKESPERKKPPEKKEPPEKETPPFPPHFMLLQPPPPLRTAEDIHAAIRLLQTTGSDSIISVCETDHSPLWCNTLDANHDMEHFLPEPARQARSQDLPVYYRLNGAIYLANITRFRKEKTFFMKGSRALVMDREHSVDIDTLPDLLLAEQLLLLRKQPDPVKNDRKKNSQGPDRPRKESWPDES